MKLAWHAIVKNETAIIDRCVASLLPHIDCAIITDTGSTDGTPARLTELFTAAGKPLQLNYVPFVNFEQTRNAALQEARGSPLQWDYLLLCDADMELKVNKPDWINGHRGQAYDLLQRSGTLSYWNRRLVHRDAVGDYVGVTHEYLNIPSVGKIVDAEFVDHADGANRPDKITRDIALLESALSTETKSGMVARYTFYLAASYYDLKQWATAAMHYGNRVRMGHYEEERWYSQYRLALCWKSLGEIDKFVAEMLRAYQIRPGRAESLVELAKYFREQGNNHTSLLFSYAGLQVPYPKDDRLFIGERACQFGARNEFAICAYYNPLQREQGARVCNELSLSKDVFSRQQAWHNQYWYLSPLKRTVPSFYPQRIEFTPPEGYVAMNPSVINEHNNATVLVRTVNYTITPEGYYVIRADDGVANSDNPIHTRNHLVRLRCDKEPEVTEISSPSDWPKPKYDLVCGFEDSRLFMWEDRLWTISTVRELSSEGWCEQVLAPVDGAQYGNWSQILSGSGLHEKNWMPWLKDGVLSFVYRLDTLVDIHGAIIAKFELPIDVSRISGGSQVIRISPEMNLAIVHETNFIPGKQTRYYQHRFACFNRSGKLTHLSMPFSFHDRQIEFCAGLAYFHADRKLVASYGVRDCEAWLATMDIDEVIKFLGEPL